MKRGAVVGIVAGAAVVALLAGGTWWFVTRPQSPEDAARTYLDALASGDYATIDGMLGDGAGDIESLVEEAFVGASGYITEPGIAEISSDGDGAATVSADVELGGEPRELSFSLEETDGGWMLVGDHLAELRVDTTLAGQTGGDAVWIGAALAPANIDLSLLPAEYDVQAAPRGILSGTATAVVSTDEPTTIALETTIAPEATAAAQTQLNAYMDECTATAAEVPESCGLRVPWAVDLTSLDTIAFRIEERPAVVLSGDGTRFEATGGVVVATASGTPRAGSPATVTYRADDWALRGSVRFTGDEMVLLVG
ncbi:hypothetical protein [Microbacterium sulfonylureivorans]|uniref:hypothetical protein n=1 Tax=Microbacterium sulfonylureivorans TaxID=2486854 RepID=UPI000FD9FA19|nr:hypothetical protein [Microbacterium sulfonylureivorans]